MQYVAEIAYNGSNYHGWQAQKNAHSIQAEFTNALEKAIGTKQMETLGCGRTDTGVHALKYFVQFNCEQTLGNGFIFKLNQALPIDIAAKTLYTVPANCNVRFDATYRLYEYHLHQKPNPFANQRSYYRYGAINFEDMNAAAAQLLQHTNFECFSKNRTNVKNYNCRVTHAKWIQTAPHTWVFYIQANRFLRNMVRAIVGSLIDVGTGKNTLHDFEEIIKTKKRSLAGPSVPAYALYLTDIGYDFEHNGWEKIDG